MGRKVTPAPAVALSLPLVLHRPVPGLRGRAGPAAAVRKDTGGASTIGTVHCSLRQRCGVLVRKSCAFSKKPAMRTARIKIVIDNYKL